MESSRAAESPTARRDPARSEGEIFVHPPEVEPGFVTTTVRGLDTGAPRELVLWRLAEHGTSRLARTRSQAGGSFVFPQVPVPNRPLKLVVSPAGHLPDDPEATPPFSLTAERPEAAGVGPH